MPFVCATGLRSIFGFDLGGTLFRRLYTATISDVYQTCSVCVLLDGVYAQPFPTTSGRISYYSDPALRVYMRLRFQASG